jgi:hypothetical protein
MLSYQVMTRVLIGTLIGAMLTISTLAAAHHSAAVLYDVDKETTVEGVVTRFALGNPHARIFMMVTDDSGREAEWMAEGGSRTVLLRLGWSEDQLKAGDRIQIIGNPSRDGSNIFHFEKVVLPNGTELWGEDIPDDSVLEDLRRRR